MEALESSKFQLGVPTYPEYAPLEQWQFYGLYHQVQWHYVSAGTTAPPGAATLDASQIGRAIKPELSSANYGPRAYISQPGKVRIFIQGDKLSEGPCFWAEVNSQINSPLA